MHYRARQFGATLKFLSRSEGGTEVRLEMRMIQEPRAWKPSKAQLMLVDDHAMFRHGMAMLINREPDMEVSAEAGDCEEALAILKPERHPDIVLMDVSLKTLSGLEVIKRMHSLIPALPVLVVSMYDESVCRASFAGGGSRLRDETGAGQGAGGAIREILKGNLYLSKQIQARLLKRVATGNSGSEPRSTLCPPPSLKYCI